MSNGALGLAAFVIFFGVIPLIAYHLEQRHELAMAKVKQDKERL